MSNEESKKGVISQTFPNNVIVIWDAAAQRKFLCREKVGQDMDLQTEDHVSYELEDGVAVNVEKSDFEL